MLRDILGTAFLILSLVLGLVSRIVGTAAGVVGSLGNAIPVPRSTMGTGTQRPFQPLPDQPLQTGVRADLAPRVQQGSPGVAAPGTGTVAPVTTVPTASNIAATSSTLGAAPTSTAPASGAPAQAASASTRRSGPLDRFAVASQVESLREVDRQLFQAVWSGNARGVEEALAAGADPAARDALNMTPLHWCANNDDAGVARVLLDRGVDVNVRGFDSPSDGPSNSTPLILAAQASAINVARLLLDRGADVNAISGNETSQFRRSSTFWAKKSNQQNGASAEMAPFLESRGGLEFPPGATRN